jgi:hypothetical protein
VELEQPNNAFKPAVDRRPYMPEPPPVRLVAVEDVRGFAGAGLEVQLDEFYVGLLRFDRDMTEEAQIVYRAENVRLVLDVVEPPLQRDDFWPIPVEVQSLSVAEHDLIEREIEFEWQRGLSVARDTLLLRDPAGNWVAITERREVG